MEQLVAKARQEVEKESGAWAGKGAEHRCAQAKGARMWKPKVGATSPQQPHGSCHVQ